MVARLLATPEFAEAFKTDELAARRNDQHSAILMDIQ